MNGCAMTPQPSISLPVRTCSGKAAAALLQLQARIACLGAAG